MAMGAALPARADVTMTFDTAVPTVNGLDQANFVDDATIARLSARTEARRAEQYVARTLMLLKMYRVLTPEQRRQLHEMTKGKPAR